MGRSVRLVPESTVSNESPEEKFHVFFQTSDSRTHISAIHTKVSWKYAIILELWQNRIRGKNIRKEKKLMLLRYKNYNNSQAWLMSVCPKSLHFPRHITARNGECLWNEKLQRKLKSAYIKFELHAHVMLDFLL